MDCDRNPWSEWELQKYTPTPRSDMGTVYGSVLLRYDHTLLENIKRAIWVQRGPLNNIVQNTSN